MEDNKKTIKDYVELLDEITKEYNVLYQKKHNTLEEFKQAVVVDIQNRLRAQKLQSFIFSVQGTYTETYGFGPRNNMTREHSYHWIYTGHIAYERDFKSDFPGEPTKSFFSGSDFKFPCESVYVLKDAGKAFDIADGNELYLQYREKNGPEWGIEDLLRSYLSEETEKSIFPRSEFSRPFHGPKITLAIGEEEVKRFEDSQGDLFKMKIGNLRSLVNFS